MPMACILVFAVLAAAPPLPGQLSRNFAMRATHSETRPRATLAARASDPPRWSSGYRSAQLDLRWHAADADRIDASAAPGPRPPRSAPARPLEVAALADPRSGDRDVIADARCRVERAVLADPQCRTGTAAITASCPR